MPSSIMDLTFRATAGTSFTHSTSEHLPVFKSSDASMVSTWPLSNSTGSTSRSGSLSPSQNSTTSIQPKNAYAAPSDAEELSDLWMLANLAARAKRIYLMEKPSLARRPSRAVVDGSDVLFCGVCDFHTLRKHHLKRHMLTHTGQKSLKCPFCDFRSARADSLKQHVVRHAKENPLICDQCGEVAQNDVDLQEHKRSQHVHQCSICSKILPTHKTLRCHERTHQSYRCQFCAFSSLYEPKVKRHERSIHNRTNAGLVIQT